MNSDQSIIVGSKVATQNELVSKLRVLSKEELLEVAGGIGLVVTDVVAPSPSSKSLDA